MTLQLAAKTDMMGPMDDDAAWAALRSGDPDGLRGVFRLHSKAVYNVAFRYCASWSVAEDATQLCFAGVWRMAVEGRLPRLSRGAVRAWLCAVGRNEARNLTRAEGRRLRLARLATSQPAVGSRDNVDEWVEQEQSMQAINRVLERLPDAQRQVVELVAWGGCSMAEVAEALRVPVGTVKSRLARARTTLATSEVAALLGKEN